MIPCQMSKFLPSFIRGHDRTLHPLDKHRFMMTIYSSRSSLSAIPSCFRSSDLFLLSSQSRLQLWHRSTGLQDLGSEKIVSQMRIDVHGQIPRVELGGDSLT